MVEVDCPHCGERVGSSGYPSHAHNRHNVDWDVASRELRNLKIAAGIESGSASSSSDAGPSSGGSQSFAIDAVDYSDDPEVRELQKEVEKAKLESELERIQGSNGTADDDFLEKLIRVRKAGLLGDGGSGGGGMDAEAVKSLLREVRESGRGGVVSAEDPIATLAANNVKDPELFKIVAESEPAVKQAEIELTKLERKIESRKELADRVFAGVGELGGDAIGSLLSGVLDASRRGPAAAPQGEPPRAYAEGGAGVVDGDPETQAREYREGVELGERYPQDYLSEPPDADEFAPERPPAPEPEREPAPSPSEPSQAAANGGEDRPRRRESRAARRARERMERMRQEGEPILSDAARKAMDEAEAEDDGQDAEAADEAEDGQDTDDEAEE